MILRSNGPIGLCSPGHDGFSINPNIIMSEYITSHTYPGPGNYIFCFEQANRNAGVVNIPNSVNQPMSFESLLVIPMFGSGHNNSPVFGNHPLAYGCINNGCYTYNSLASDTDGDSLSYIIAPCVGHQGATASGYAYPNTGAGGTFSINPITGLLTWCDPQFNGDYNVVIKIEEWRKDDDGTYYLVGYVKRDTQLTISNCTGIKQIEVEETILSVSPNPITDNFTITFNQNYNELFTIDLFDVAGRKIETLIANESLGKQNTLQLKLDNINQGIYFLKITGNHHTHITKKIIKH